MQSGLVSVLRALQAAWAAGNHPPFRLLGPLMYLMHQVSGLPLLSRSILALHRVPFCGLLRFGGGGKGWDFLFICCFMSLFSLSLFYLWLVKLSLCLVWFWCLCLPVLGFDLGVFLLACFIDKGIEDIHSTCFWPHGRDSSLWKHTGQGGIGKLLLLGPRSWESSLIWGFFIFPKFPRCISWYQGNTLLI